MSNAALIVAAGRGERLGTDVAKQYLDLGGKMLLRHAVDRMMAHDRIDLVRVVIAEGQEALCREALGGLDQVRSVTGADSRQGSVLNGLRSLKSEAPKNVLIHDAARPFLPRPVVDRVLAALAAHTGVIPVLAVTDSLKRSDGEWVDGDVPRDGLYRAQTPQGFRFDLILAAHERAAHEQYTDDAALARGGGQRIAMVEGSEDNFKITTAADWSRAQAQVRGRFETRTGQGFDVHRFGPGAQVTLCGVAIPHDHALIGHSDADVALHALTDALLGAIGAGDIGSHFPADAARWRGADSRRFLRHAAQLIRDRGGRLRHVDVTIICERPRLAPYREAMRQSVADVLAIDLDRVAVKATTTEGLGFTGRGEGIAAQAIATVGLPAGS